MRLIDADELLKQPIDKANYPSNFVRVAKTIYCWTPTSERLPDKSGSYLVTTKNGIVMVGKYDKFITAAWIGRIKDVVIAWAELPEPYKE